MKKLLCLLLALSIVSGAFAFSAFAEESNGNDVSIDISSPDDSSQPDDTSMPDDSSQPDEVSQPEDSSQPDEVSQPEDSSEPSDSSDVPGEECEVSVTYEKADGTVTGFDESATYHVGETLSLNINPNSKKGVASITVNGEEMSNAPVSGGSVAILLDDAKVDIVITFADAVKVIIDCGDGGSFTVKDRPDVEEGQNFDVLVGTDVVIRISANANQALNSISDNGSKVEKLTYTYTIKDIDKNHSIVITFRETGDTDVEKYDLTIKIEGKGVVRADGQEITAPYGVVQIEHGNDVELELIPDSGYVIKAITDFGETKNIQGDTYTVKQVTRKRTVTVIFGKENGEDVNDSSETDDSSQATDTPENSAEVITRAEVENSISGNRVFISLAKKTRIGREALAYINELAKNESLTISIGVSGSYQWVLPKGASFAANTDNINFGVNVDTGAVSADIKKVLPGKIDSSLYDLQNAITVERLAASLLPEGTRLEISAKVSYGKSYGWFKYERSGSVLPVYGVNGALAKVAGDGAVTVDMPAPQLYGVLVPYRGESVSATIKWNGKGCKIFAPGVVTVGANGESSVVVNWQKGVDLSVSLKLGDGIAIESISTVDFTDMKLFAGDLDVTATAAREEKGTVNIVIPAISKDGAVVVQTTESGEQDVSSPGGKTPWDVIILIVVIVIAMVAGGVVFVVKWRQYDGDDGEDDDDDDDDDDYDDDDE